MSVYKSPYDMYEAREKSSRKRANEEYFLYCQMRRMGKYYLSNIHYLKSQRYYALMKANAEDKEKSKGKTWKEHLKKKVEIEAMPF